jgi:hypothetical protein
MSDATKLVQRITPEALCQERTDALLQHQQLLAQLNTERALVEEASRTIAELHKQVSQLRAALSDLYTLHRTFRDVPQADQQWTSLDDDAMTQAEAALA